MSSIKKSYAYDEIYMPRMRKMGRPKSIEPRERRMFSMTPTEWKFFDDFIKNNGFKDDQKSLALYALSRGITIND